MIKIIPINIEINNNNNVTTCKYVEVNIYVVHTRKLPVVAGSWTTNLPTLDNNNTNSHIRFPYLVRHRYLLTKC